MTLTPEQKISLFRFMNSKIMNRTVALLIVLSVFLLFLENVYTSSQIIRLIGDGIMLIFAVELGMRYLAARSRKVFFRTYWIDIVSLLPLLGPWRILRALRLLRLLRLGALLDRSDRRFASIIRQTFGDQLFLLNLIFVFVVGVALAILGLENHQAEFDTVEDTVWWAIFSLIAGEPVGAIPHTFWGKVFTTLIMIGGVTVFALFTGTVSAVMAERFRQGHKGIMMNFDDLHNHLIICGWNRSGRTLLEEVMHPGHAEDLHIVVIAEVRPEFGPVLDHDPGLFFLQGDYTNADILKQAGVTRARTAILLADKSLPHRSDQDRDARTILAALMIEKLHPGIFSCAELLSRQNEQHLVMAGIEEIVIADEYSATILATSSRLGGVTEIADEIFSNKYGNQIYKRIIRPEWAGRTFVEVASIVKEKHDALVLAVEHAPEMGSDDAAGKVSRHARTTTNPPAHEIIHKTDRLVVLAKTEPRW